MAMARRTERHWWNGKWGRLARRDVYLRAEGEGFAVEAREGGPDGDKRLWRPPTEETALLLVKDLLSDQDTWRELTVRP